MVIFAKDIIAWTGKGINKLRSCESYELYGKIPVCKGMEKFSSILLEQPTETGRMFDNGLFLAFVFGFFSFLLTSMYTILVEDRKSLKEISNKVIRTTDTIVTVLRAMWTLKVSKESNSMLEQELIEINKIKVPNPYVSLENMKEEIIPAESKGSEEIEFVEQIEFSLHDEWHPPKDDQNKLCLTETPAAHLIGDAGDNNWDLASVKGTTKPSPCLLKSVSGITKHTNKDPNLQVLYEKKVAESYSLHSRYDDTSRSHGENLREAHWSTTNSYSNRQNKRCTPISNNDSRRQHSPDFRTVNRQPSRMSYMSYSSKKYRSNNEGNNELPSRGIFDQRRRDKARARRSNSSERNGIPWDMMSMNASVNVKTRNLPNDNKFNRENRTSIMSEYSR